MKEFKRAIHFDFHTLPGIYDFNGAFDPEEFAQTLADSKVDYINLTAKCNSGYLYYNSKIGEKYPDMKGDMFGETLKACKKRGIAVTAYFNMGLDHVQALKHREWCRVNENGQVLFGDRSGNFFRTMCLNTGYKDYALSLVQEVVDNYDIDGIFMDCLEPTISCYGSECADEILSAGGNPNDQETVYKHSLEVFKDFCRKAKAIVGDDKYFFANGSISFAIPELITHREIECLTSSANWGYELFGASVAYGRNIKEKTVFMTGRFQDEWGDFGGYKGKPALENDLWEAFSNGVWRVSIGDHLHPARNLNPYVYNSIKEIYAQTSKLDEYVVGAKYLAEVGVVLAPPHHILRENHKGLARMLAELKVAFDIVDENMSFEKYKILILPDDVLITPILKEKIQKHLNKGGKIISSGISGLNEEKTDFALQEWKDAFEFKGIDKSNSGYFRFTKNYMDNPPDMDFSMYEYGMLFKAKEKSTVLADYVKAYFNKGWDGRHSLYYAPPEKKTGDTAIAISENIVQICFNIFESYNKNAMLEHKYFIKYCLDKFYDKPLIKHTTLPSTARVTITESEKYRNLHVKVTFPEMRGEKQIIEEHQTVCAGHTVTVRGEYSKVYSAPDKTPVQCVVENGYTKIILPFIEGYKLFVLEK